MHNAQRTMYNIQHTTLIINACFQTSMSLATSVKLQEPHFGRRLWLEILRSSSLDVQPETCPVQRHNSVTVCECESRVCIPLEITIHDSVIREYNPNTRVR